MDVAEREPRPSADRRERGDSHHRWITLRRLFVALLLAGVGAGTLAACGDDDSSDAVPPPTRLTDPCRLISATQLRQELGVEFSERSAGDPPPVEGEVTELSCSWISLDPEAEPSEDYLDEEVPRFIDVVVRKSDPDDGFDVAALMDEIAADAGATEVPELLATEEDATLADAAVAVGGSLFVVKGDVLMTISTDSAASLDQLMPEVVPRTLRRL